MTVKPTTQPDRLTEELGMLMGKARRRYWAAISRRLEGSGDSLLLWQVLCQLTRVGRSTQADLGNAVGREPPQISRLLESLERQGLVTRERDNKDRRRVYVKLTRIGRERFEAMRPSVREAAVRCFGPLSLDQRRTLRDLLTRLTEVEMPS